MIYDLLAKLLGAGAGWVGSIWRTTLAGLGGYLTAKGLDAATVQGLVDWLVNGAPVLFALLGSWLNNKANESKAD